MPHTGTDEYNQAIQQYWPRQTPCLDPMADGGRVKKESGSDTFFERIFGLVAFSLRRRGSSRRGAIDLASDPGRYSNVC